MKLKLAGGSGDEAENYFDLDAGDAQAVTECYAALELQTYLARLVEQGGEEIQFSPPTNLPDKGDVLILGSAGSNPLIP